MTTMPGQPMAVRGGAIKTSCPISSKQNTTGTSSFWNQVMEGCSLLVDGFCSLFHYTQTINDYFIIHQVTMVMLDQ